MANPFKAPKFRDDEVAVAWQTFAGDGIPEVIKRGTRLRGNHPAVRRWPQFFVADGTPANEWPTNDDLPGVKEAAAEADRRFRAEQAQKYPTVPAEEAVVCIQGFAIGQVAVQEGEVRRRDSEIVQKYPQYFAEWPRPLTEAALRAQRGGAA